EERRAVALLGSEPVGDLGKVLLGDLLEIQAHFVRDVREVPEYVAEFLSDLVRERAVTIPFSHPLLVLREQRASFPREAQEWHNNRLEVVALHAICEDRLLLIFPECESGLHHFVPCIAASRCSMNDASSATSDLSTSPSCGSPT